MAFDESTLLSNFSNQVTFGQRRAIMKVVREELSKDKVHTEEVSKEKILTFHSTSSQENAGSDYIILDPNDLVSSDVN